jgi:hypothetical protein
MAIHDGTSDFQLQVSRASGLRSIFIKWNKTGTNLQKTVQVFRPGDGKMVFTRTYGRDIGSAGLTVDLPFFGEYYVKIFLETGYSWDGMKFDVALNTTQSSTHTYTSTDVSNYRKEQLIVWGTFTTLGFSSKAAIKITASTLGIYLSALGILQHDTSLEGILPPREGWKLRTTFSPFGTDQVKVTLTTLTPDNGTAQTLYRYFKHLKYKF